jgi:hypothetical protein
VTIVVSGFALGAVNSYSAPAVYGYTLKTQAQQQPTVTQLLDLSIAQWYAIDYRVKRRRPVTKIEFALLRQFLEIAQRAKKQYAADARAMAKLERQFGTIGYRPRLQVRGDVSGLRPVKRSGLRTPKRRESRGTA